MAKIITCPTKFVEIPVRITSKSVKMFSGHRGSFNPGFIVELKIRISL
jgi:hypothetical protein